MNQKHSSRIPELLHERAIALHKIHETHSVSVLELALRDGAQIMAEHGAAFIFRERDDLRRQRNKANLPQ